MINIPGLSELDNIFSFTAGSNDSIFTSTLMTFLSSVYVWIPTLLLVLVIILRNNDKHNSIAITVCMASCAVCVFLLNEYLIQLSIRSSLTWSLAIYIILLFKSWHSSFVFLALSIIQTFSSMYKDECGFGLSLLSTAAGLIIGVLIYFIFALLTRNRTKYIKTSSNNIYSKSGYLVNDLTVISIVIYATVIVLVFASIIIA